MNDAQTLYFQALKAHRSKDYDDAIELLKQALEMDPKHEDSWEAVGVLYDKVGRLDEAIKATEALIALNPNSIMAQTNLSRFYMKMGLTEKAEEAQGKARLLGWKQELSNPGSGNEDLQQASTGETSTAPVNIASILEGPKPVAPQPVKPSSELLEQKIRQFQALLDSNPEDTLSRLTLGKTLLQADQPDAALEHLEKLIEMRGDYSAAYVVLAQAYEKAGKLAKALKTLNRGIEVAKQNGDLHPRNQMLEHLAALRG